MTNNSQIKRQPRTPRPRRRNPIRYPDVLPEIEAKATRDAELAHIKPAAVSWGRVRLGVFGYRK
jgi:hypothetical protein